MASQELLQTLYESRMASLQRLVGFMVLFHKMGKMVQDFWPLISFGLLGYDMSRTQSIMRVASTAAPVSGSEVRFKMLDLVRETREKWAIRTLQIFFRLLRVEKGKWELERLTWENAAMKEMEAIRRRAELPKEQEGDALHGLVNDITESAGGALQRRGKLAPLRERATA